MSVKKIINIDSRFRNNVLSTNSNDFNVQLNYNLDNVTSIKLYNIQLPNSWYNISSSIENNTFSIDGYEYIVPDGNYISSSLVTKVKTLVSDDEVGLIFDQSGTGFNITVDEDSGKTTFSSKNSNNFDLIFNEINQTDHSTMNTFGWTIGFRKISYTGSNSYTSEGIFNSGGFNYLYLIVDDNNTHSTDLVIGNLKDSFIADNILALIRVNTDDFSIVNTDDYENQKRTYTKPVRIRQLSIKLLDPYGNLINLNNMDFSFAIEFEIKI